MKSTSSSSMEEGYNVEEQRRKLAWEERKLVTAGGIFHLKAQLQIEEMEKGAKSEAAASLRRCAKAALLLHSLNSPISQNQWKREIHDLKIELLKERFMRKKMKLCAITELFVQLLLLLSVCNFVLL
uniref:Uncharacterized protein n=1 Tax=Glycine max TaxID=3847 RepID=A0A0R0GEG1_SOYBN